MSFANLVTQLYIFSLLYILGSAYVFVHPPPGHATSPLYAAVKSCPPHLLLHTCQEQKEGKKTSRKKSKGDFFVFAPGQHVS